MTKRDIAGYLNILYDLHSKTYEMFIEYSNNLALVTPVLTCDVEPIFYEQLENGELKEY